jgi:hypothetical protein
VCTCALLMFNLSPESPESLLSSYCMVTR